MNRIVFHIVIGLLVVGCVANDQHRVDTSNVSRGVTVRDKTANGAPLPGGNRLKLLKMVPPDYPVDLRRANVTGVVTIQHTVQPDGTVTDVSVVRSPDARLNDLAIVAVSKWRYEPYTPADGKPLSFMVPITFSRN